MELLSPAGNFEKLKYAIYYGADAVYVGVSDLSLRAGANIFNIEDIKIATDFCHNYNRKIYITTNIYAHNRHIDELKSVFKSLSNIKVDALIISDIGVLELAKEFAGNVPIHISTQANVSSYQAVKSYQKLGAKRIILARELNKDELFEIRQKCPDVELEIFVHGAMCISYSGRCLISSYLTNRSANLGYCTQPCRWKFDLVEEKRPNEIFSLLEDKNGAYFMNSKDLCLINKLNEIKEIGINSIKIEGRMKSLYYVACVTRAYSQALKDINENKTINNFWEKELEKISHRIYTEGFFSKTDQSSMQNYESSVYIKDWQFVGNIIEKKESFIGVNCYHKITRNDEINIIFPDHCNDLTLTNIELFDDKFNEIDFTKPNTIFYLKTDKFIPEKGIIRINQNKNEHEK
jgi:putative protease